MNNSSNNHTRPQVIFTGVPITQSITGPSTIKGQNLYRHVSDYLDRQPILS